MMMMMMIMLMMTMIVIDASSWMSMGAKQGGNDQSAPKSEKSQTAEISAIHRTLRIANQCTHVLHKTVTCNVAVMIHQIS